MGSPTVTMVFDAQTAAFVQNILKAQSALEATANKAREAGEAVAKSSSGFAAADKSAGSMTASLTSMASGYLAVAAAVASAAAMVKSYNDEMKRKSEAGSKEIGDLYSSVMGLNRPGDYAKIKSGLSGIQSSLPNARKEEIFGQLAGIVGDKFSTEQMIGAVDAGVHSGAKDPARFAATKLQLSSVRKTGGGWEKLSDDDMTNLAMTVMKKSPEGLSERQIEGLKTDSNKNRGFAALIAGMEGDENARVVKHLKEMSLLEPSKQEQKKWRHERKLSAEELSRKKIFNSGANPDQRWDAMVKNPSMLAPEYRGAMVDFAASYRPNLANEVIGEKPYDVFNASAVELRSSNPEVRGKAQLDEQKRREADRLHRDRVYMANREASIQKHVQDAKEITGMTGDGAGLLFDQTVRLGFTVNEALYSATLNSDTWKKMVIDHNKRGFKDRDHLEKIADHLENIEDHTERQADLHAQALAQRNRDSMHSTEDK